MQRIGIHGLIAGALLLPACASPTLVDRLAARGVTERNTYAIVFRDNGANFPADIRIEVSSLDGIGRVWDSIHQARPDDRWVASGYRLAEFYTGVPPRMDLPPAVTLYLNASGACFIDSPDDKESAYRCPGLHQMAMDYILPAIKRQSSQSAPALEEQETR